MPIDLDRVDDLNVSITMALKESLGGICRLDNDDIDGYLVLLARDVERLWRAGAEQNPVGHIYEDLKGQTTVIARRFRTDKERSNAAAAWRAVEALALAGRILSRHLTETEPDKEG